MVNKISVELLESLKREGFKNAYFPKDKEDYNNLVVISIDLGNRFAKIVFAILDEKGQIVKIVRVLEPSVVLERKYKEVSESFGEEKNNYYSLSVGGNEFVFGNDVGDSENAIDLYGKSNRVNEEYVVSIVAILEKYIGLEKLKTHDLHLCLGTPNNDKKGEEEITMALINLKQGVKNGVPFDINIASFEINNQSNSAMVSQMFDDVTLKPKNAHYKLGEYGIADLGFGTADLNRTKDGSILENETRSYDLGIVEVILEIQKHIKTEKGIDVSFNKIHENFVDGYVKLTKTKIYDYSDFKDKALKSYARKLKKLFTTHFGRLEMLDGILLFGGTAIIVYPYIVEELKDIDVELILVENPQMAVSDGQFKRGVYTKIKMQKELTKLKK